MRLNKQKSKKQRDYVFTVSLKDGDVIKASYIKFLWQVNKISSQSVYNKLQQVHFNVRHQHHNKRIAFPLIES